MIGQILRILTFRAGADDHAALAAPHLLVGVLATWLVGIGRYWDNPRASQLQHAGVGSLVYIVALSALLYVVGLGLRPGNWSFVHVLTFVSITSLPGLIYAIPVERLLEPEQARSANLWFLATVATWRMAMYGVYLRRHARLGWLPLVVQLLLPVTAILVALTVLNLEHAVFDIMGGVQRQTTSADKAYELVFTLTMLSFLVAPVLLALYAFLAWRAWSNHPFFANLR